MRLRGLYRVLLVLPWAVPTFVSAFAWRYLFHQEYGLINGVLSSVGLAPVDWFDHQWTSLSTAIVATLVPAVASRTSTWFRLDTAT